MNKLMQIVAEHGTGNDILEMANLLRSAGKNVPYEPVTKIKHIDGENVYECLGFTPSETFSKMSEIEDSLGKPILPTKIYEQMLKDQQTTEQMALICCLLINEIGINLTNALLGARKRRGDDDALPF